MNWPANIATTIAATTQRRKRKSSASPEPDPNHEKNFIWMLASLLLAILGAAMLVFTFAGCAQYSPGAKISTVINVSIMPPASVVPSL